MQNGGSKIKILVVDDDALFLESICDLLEQKGFAATCVDSGKKALQKFKKNNFDVVLVAVKMKDVDAVDILKGVKEVASKVPVIMMAASNDHDKFKEALNEGAYSTLSKPLDCDNLLKTIETAAAGGVRLLIVDDDSNVRVTLSDILEYEGCSVATAASGEEAIQLAQKRRFDLAFVDMKLPDFSGLWVYLALQKINREMSVVLITGFREEMQAETERALLEGADACLYKPFDLKNVVDMAKGVLTQSSSHGRKHEEKDTHHR